jgi:hypothetical protein
MDLSLSRFYVFYIAGDNSTPYFQLAFIGKKKPGGCTDKKEENIFLIYKEIQSGAVAKSYMRKGFLIYEEMRKYFPIYEVRRPF